MEDFDQPQIGKVAVERRSRTFSGLLNRVNWKFKSYAAGFANTVLDAPRELNVMPIAGCEIAACLCDSDDWTSGLKLRACETEVEVALEIEGGHAGIGWIVEPKSTP